VIATFLASESRKDAEYVAPLLPKTQTLDGCVCMFLDVSGFTALTEEMSRRASGGLELLAKYLNSYFEQLVRIVAHSGGDVLKFAGDALLVLWRPIPGEELQTKAMRTVACGLEIQKHMHQAHIGDVSDDVVLSVKVGIGCGEVAIIHVGGVNDGSVDRVEYVTTGDPLIQAFGAEHCAVSGDVICSPEVAALVRDGFDMEAVPDAAGQMKVLKALAGKKQIRHRGVRRYTTDDR
jgi:adenylate cyclase 10